MKLGQLTNTNMETAIAITATVSVVASAVSAATFEGFGDWGTTKPDRGKQA